MIDMDGRDFFQATKMAGEKSKTVGVAKSGFAQDGKRVELSKPECTGGTPLYHAIASRRSIRNFSQEALAESTVSQILWASQGITRRRGNRSFRASPSAGALYPIDTWLSIKNVDGIEPGLYGYLPEEHALMQRKSGDFSNPLCDAALSQGMVKDVPVVFIWSAAFSRCTGKYGDRGYRYVHLDAGHIAHAVALACSGMGLGTCQIGAFYDDEVNAILGLDGEKEAVVYMTAVGTHRSK